MIAFVTSYVFFKSISHEFIRPINFIWYGDDNQRFKEMKQILSLYNPRSILIIGKCNYMGRLPFEYRKKALEFSSLNDVSIPMIENCIF